MNVRIIHLRTTERKITAKLAELNIHHQEIRNKQQIDPNHPDIDKRLGSIDDIIGWFLNNEVPIKLNPDNDKYERDY